MDRDAEPWPRRPRVAVGLVFGWPKAFRRLANVRA
jgi:hypothetical protein